MFALGRNRRLRIGSGIDAHRLVPGRSLVLGGVPIPFGKGLEGHSDADVLTHSLMDALLGASNEGDIGLLFPDTDARLEGIESLELLKDVVRRVRAKGYSILNVDITVVCEEPRIGPFRERIMENIASVLHIDPARVSVKATTTEGMGFIGRGEGILSQAVVLLT